MSVPSPPRTPHPIPGTLRGPAAAHAVPAADPPAPGREPGIPAPLQGNLRPNWGSKRAGREGGTTPPPPPINPFLTRLHILPRDPNTPLPPPPHRNPSLGVQHPQPSPGHGRGVPAPPPGGLTCKALPARARGPRRAPSAARPPAGPPSPIGTGALGGGGGKMWGAVGEAPKGELGGPGTIPSREGCGNPKKPQRVPRGMGVCPRGVPKAGLGVPKRGWRPEGGPGCRVKGPGGPWSTSGKGPGGGGRCLRAVVGSGGPGVGVVGRLTTQAGVLTQQAV